MKSYYIKKQETKTHHKFIYSQTVKLFEHLKIKECKSAQKYREENMILSIEVQKYLVKVNIWFMTKLFRKPRSTSFTWQNIICKYYVSESSLGRHIEHLLFWVRNQIVILSRCLPCLSISHDSLKTLQKSRPRNKRCEV